jgi:DNA-binding SARP family transcriptional activator
METKPKQSRLESPSLERNSEEQVNHGQLEIRLLGGFGVRLGQFEVPDSAFVRRKPKSLLKLLALQSGNRMHRDQIIETLWAGLQPLGGAAQLYKAVHQARKALLVAGAGILPETILVLKDEELRLKSPGGVRTDVERFLTLARVALASRDRAALEQALAAYEGDLLPTDLYEDWTQPALRSNAGSRAPRVDAGFLPSG